MSSPPRPNGAMVFPNAQLMLTVDEAGGLESVSCWLMRDAPDLAELLRDIRNSLQGRLDSAFNIPMPQMATMVVQRDKLDAALSQLATREADICVVMHHIGVKTDWLLDYPKGKLKEFLRDGRDWRHEPDRSDGMGAEYLGAELRKDNIDEQSREGQHGIAPENI